MIPPDYTQNGKFGNIPRASGDDPAYLPDITDNDQYSPRERG